MNEKWMAKAKCQGIDWFVNDGRLHEKREICATCTVKKECLAFALENEDIAPVVYAGTTGNQRKVLL